VRGVANGTQPRSDFGKRTDDNSPINFADTTVSPFELFGTFQFFSDGEKVSLLDDLLKKGSLGFGAVPRTDDAE